MAVAVMGDIPEEVYDQVNEAMFGTTRPTEPIEGLVIHTIAKGPNGFRVFDVWESQEAFENFTNGKVMPAMEEAGIPMEGGTPPEIVDLVHVIVNEEARV